MEYGSLDYGDGLGSGTMEYGTLDHARKRVLDLEAAMGAIRGDLVSSIIGSEEGSMIPYNGEW